MLPVAVAGQRSFHQLSAGRLHTCAVTLTRAAYCWGDNRNGGVGDGTGALLRRRPTLVAGQHAFAQIDAGGHTCGVNAKHQAYCWGSGGNGEVGDGTYATRRAPSAVAGGVSFSRISAGTGHACGETSGSLAYCWGANNYGQLGDGSGFYQRIPVAVTGGITFAQVSSAHGGVHSCGITRSGWAYCWGYNALGELGDGTTTDRQEPVAVVGVT